MEVVSNNGPQFSNEEFAECDIYCEFEHLTSSPGSSKANGKAEAAVKVAKDLIRKTIKTKGNLNMALLKVSEYNLL